jgi:hypothetical protein
MWDWLSREDALIVSREFPKDTRDRNTEQNGMCQKLFDDHAM